MNYQPDFSNLLNQELIRQDRTASWLAQRLGVNPSTVTRWLNHGTRPGNPELVARIADVLGMRARLQELLVAAGYGYQAGEIESEAVQVSAGRQTAGREREFSTGGIVDAGDESRDNTVQLQAVNAILPIPATPLVGRQAEIDLVAEWLTSTSRRLATIVAPGGMGKTRLGIAIAQQQSQNGHHVHGVAFVPLAPLAESEQIPPAVAEAVGLRLEGGSQPRLPDQQIIDYLRNRQLLLVLDNAEHLVGLGAIVDEILRNAPDVRILITSREPLGLAQEQILRLDGLSQTDPNVNADSEYDAPAIVLFLQSARRLEPDYVANDSALDSIAEICRLVGGMPLAIELAASWLPTLPAAEIAAEIRDSLDFLATDQPGTPQRHRSMRAIFDASIQRLDEAEQHTFFRLSVFRGGFSRYAAEMIADADLLQLRSLIAHSLLTFDREQGRYVVHELLRQFGAHRLSEDREIENSTCRRHNDFYFELAKTQGLRLKGSEQRLGLHTLDADDENLSAASHWAVRQNNTKSIAVTMDHLGLYYDLRGRSVEGAATFRMFTEVFEENNETISLARAFAWLARFERLQEHFALSSQLLQRSLDLLDEIFEAHNDAPDDYGFVYLKLGDLNYSRDNLAARDHYECSRVLYEKSGDAWSKAASLMGLSDVVHTEGDYARQADYGEQAMAIYRQLGYTRGIAAALLALSDADTYGSNPERGLARGLESLTICQEIEDEVGIGISLRRIGNAYQFLGRVEESIEMRLKSRALFADIGHRRDEIMALTGLSVTSTSLGHYEQACIYIQDALGLAIEIDDRMLSNTCFALNGRALLYRGDFAAAIESLAVATPAIEQTGNLADLSFALAVLGAAESRAGQNCEARMHCYRSLQIGVERPFPTLWGVSAFPQLLSTIVRILVVDEELEVAIEPYRWLRSGAFLDYPWVRDEIGQRASTILSETPVTDPDKITESAEKRKVQDIAIDLLDKLRLLGWAEGTTKT